MNGLNRRAIVELDIYSKQYVAKQSKLHKNLQQHKQERYTNLEHQQNRHNKCQHEAGIYLKPKVTLHFELSNISLLLLSLTKLNIAMSCWFPPCPNS